MHRSRNAFVVTKNRRLRGNEKEHMLRKINYQQLHHQYSLLLRNCHLINSTINSVSHININQLLIHHYIQTSNLVIGCVHPVEIMSSQKRIIVDADAVKQIDTHHLLRFLLRHCL